MPNPIQPQHPHSADSSATTQAAVARLVQLYTHFSPAHLEHLHTCYAEDAHFKDPFNEVQGLAPIRQIFAHMFATLEAPRFHVTHQLVQGQQAFLAWEFHFGMRRWRAGQVQCIRGGTWLDFNPQGLVTTHRDYWDTAEELYAKLPLLNVLMRWLRKAGSASATPPRHP